MGIFSFVKPGKQIFKTITSVKPNVPKTKIQKKLRDLKIETQKLKGKTQKLKQTAFEIKEKNKKGRVYSGKELEQQKYFKDMNKGREKKMGGGMMGRRMGYSQGKLAVTPREKQLAAQYGDKKRITRGDVITAAKKKSGEEPMRDRMKQPLKKKGT